MFTLQVQDLIRQLQGQIPSPAVSAIEGAIGNCSQPLEHRAPVRIEIDGNYMPSIKSIPRGGFLGRNCDGNAVAALTVANEAGRFDGDECLTDCVTNGLAIRAVGPSQLDDTRIDRLYVGQLLDQCGDPISTGGSSSVGTGMRRFRVVNELPDPARPQLALVVPVSFGGSGYEDQATVFAVGDFTSTGEFRRRWRNNYYGFCVYKDDRTSVVISGTTYEYREVVWVESKARYIDFILTTGFSSGTAECVVISAWGATARAAVGVAEVVHDRLGLIPNAVGGYRGIAIWDEVAREYIVIAEDDQGNVQPAESLTRCVKITGAKGANCLYPGLQYSVTNLANFCDETPFTFDNAIWIYAPNFDFEVPWPSYHFGKMIDPAYDNGGDVRPLFVIKVNPDDWAPILIKKDAANQGGCMYAAKLIQFDLSGSAGTPKDGCGIAYDELLDVTLLVPELGNCTLPPEDMIVIGRRAATNVYIAMDGFADHCFPIATVGTNMLAFLCDESSNYNVLWNPGTHPHDPPASSGISAFGNPFSMCSNVTALTSYILCLRGFDTVLVPNHFLWQLERTCEQVAVGISGGGPCGIVPRYRTASIPLCNDSPFPSFLDLGSVICGCGCDGESCGCPLTTQTVNCVIRYTGRKYPGTGLPVTETITVTLHWDIAYGGWVGEFQKQDNYPVVFYFVQMRCAGDPPQGVDGYVTKGCNFAAAEVIDFYDPDFNPAGACEVIDDLFVRVIEDDITITIPCMRTYRVVFRCEHSVLGDGSDFFTGGVTIEHVSPGPPADIPAGVAVEDARGGTAKTWGCRSLHETGLTHDFGSDGGDFLRHTYCAFIDGSGEFTLTW